MTGPEAPVQAATPRHDPDDVFGRRIGAALIDLLLLFVLMLLVGLVFGEGEADGGEVSVTLEGVSAVVWFTLVLLYYFALEAQSGQTLGKRMLGVRVVRADGRGASTGEIAVRTLLRIVDALPFFYLVGFITALVTGKRRQRLGDLAAKTLVVRATSRT